MTVAAVGDGVLGSEEIGRIEQAAGFAQTGSQEDQSSDSRVRAEKACKTDGFQKEKRSGIRSEERRPAAVQR